MYNIRTHPLLAQIPLTVSPFIALPTAPTLPYTYKPLPSTLPPSSTADPSTGQELEKYILSPSGHSASPQEIITSCQTLTAHIKTTFEEAEKTIQEWERDLKEQELAEKRRVAPGWLDRDEKILKPERGGGGGGGGGSVGLNRGAQGGGGGGSIMDQQDERRQDLSGAVAGEDAAGNELDRLFGGMGLRNG